VDTVGQDHAGDHFPSIYKGHTEASKGSSEEELVHMKRKSVIVIHRLIASAGQFDSHKNTGFSGQQSCHSSQNPSQSSHMDGWRL
jgi:hypothetical protein